MIFTTARRGTSVAVDRAKNLAREYNGRYFARQDVSIEDFKDLYQDDVVIVTRYQIELAPFNQSETLFFHPNLAMIRAKRFLKGEEDPLVATAGLKEGVSFLDCTLGLASDAMIASLAVGVSGSVTGIEGDPLLYLLAREGLQHFTSGLASVDQAMRGIQVVNRDHFNFLQEMETQFL